MFLSAIILDSSTNVESSPSSLSFDFSFNPVFLSVPLAVFMSISVFSFSNLIPIALNDVIFNVKYLNNILYAFIKFLLMSSSLFLITAFKNLTLAILFK